MLQCRASSGGWVLPASVLCVLSAAPLDASSPATGTRHEHTAGTRFYINGISTLHTTRRGRQKGTLARLPSRIHTSPATLESCRLCARTHALHAHNQQPAPAALIPAHTHARAGIHAAPLHARRFNPAPAALNAAHPLCCHLDASRPNQVLPTKPQALLMPAGAHTRPSGPSHAWALKPTRHQQRPRSPCPPLPIVCAPSGVEHAAGQAGADVQEGAHAAAAAAGGAGRGVVAVLQSRWGGGRQRGRAAGGNELGGVG